MRRNVIDVGCHDRMCEKEEVWLLRYEKGSEALEFPFPI
jgi:hypothetical protein